MLADLTRVLGALPMVEWGRRHDGPGVLVERLRRAGASTRERGAVERASLRRAIRIADRLMPGGSNCYRRALLEISLDAGAAREQLHMGLKANGGPKSGHAWLDSWPDAANSASYDAVVAI